VSDVRIGVFYTAARLASGETAVAFDATRPLRHGLPPAHGGGARARAGTCEDAALAETPSPVALRRAVGVAVLNALSARAMARAGIPGRALAAWTRCRGEVQPEDRVTMVGAFVPFLRALDGRVAELLVVDKHPGALKDDERPLWRPPAEAEAALSRATVVLMTGSALVEAGIDALLAAARGARRVVMAGPTASPWPPPFFARGVHVLGGMRVRDGEAMLRLVGEGGSGYFFEGIAEKVCFVRTE
jgi:uncharacterized protein (DUF4213/DUF364 family)